MKTLTIGNTMPESNTMLKYLFTVKFADGNVWEQEAHDVSTIDPKRSAFYDVLQSGKTIDTFTLKGDGHSYSVCISDGHFEVDGVPFVLGDPLPKPATLELIFFRQHRHDFNQATQRETAHTVSYHIGWQTTINGKNYQQKLSFM